LLQRPCEAKTIDGPKKSQTPIHARALFGFRQREHAQRSQAPRASHHGPRTGRQKRRSARRRRESLAIGPPHVAAFPGDWWFLPAWLTVPRPPWHRGTCTCSEWRATWNSATISSRNNWSGVVEVSAAQQVRKQSLASAPPQLRERPAPVRRILVICRPLSFPRKTVSSVVSLTGLFL